MADIPIEERSQGGWWKWLLGLILLGLLVWLFIGLLDTGEESIEEPVENTEETAEAATQAAEGPITELTTITTANEWRDFVGREVQLQNVNVTSVVGDSTFYVSSDEGDAEVLVVLDQQLGSGSAQVEGRYDVTEGRTLRVVEGSVEELDEAFMKELGLEGTRAMEEDFYIHADRLEVTSDA